MTLRYDLRFHDKADPHAAVFAAVLQSGYPYFYRNKH